MITSLMPVARGRSYFNQKYDLFRTKKFCVYLTNERPFDNITNSPKVKKRQFIKTSCHIPHVKSKLYFECLARCRSLHIITNLTAEPFMFKTDARGVHRVS